MATTLREFLAQATGGPTDELQRILGLGYDFKKQDDYLQVTDFFTYTYGKKVWDILNSKTRFWNLLEKVPYGPTAGWRNRSARGGSSQPVGEMGALPAVTHSTIVDIFSLPRSIVTMLGTTVQAQFLGGIEGGIGDALATEQGFASVDHVKEINQELLLPAVGVVVNGGGTGVGQIAPATGFRVGDTIFSAGLPAGQAVILTISSTGVISWAGGGSLSDDNAVTVAARRGMTSLDDIIDKDGRTLPGGNNNNGPDCYNLSVRSGAGFEYAQGIVLDNNGTARDISLALLDEAIRLGREAGGEPDLILTGHGQQDNISALLQAQHRYMGVGTFQVKRGGEATLVGFPAGFQMATYKGIPVFADVDCTRSYTGTTGVAQGANVFVLDTNFLKAAVAIQTQYVESRDYLANNTLGIKAMFFTLAELRCQDIPKQVKITDLTASL